MRCAVCGHVERSIVVVPGLLCVKCRMVLETLKACKSLSEHILYDVGGEDEEAREDGTKLFA